MMQEDKYELFSMAVNLEVYDYYRSVDRPTEIATLRQKHMNGMYKTLEQFEVSQSEQQASCGMKRKAAPLPVCSSSNNELICRKTARSELGQVTTTSTQLLKAHLKGNQPKTTTTSTQLLKADLKGNQPKLKPYMVGPDAEVRDSLPLGLKEVFMQANGRTHRLLQGVHCLWCTTCKVSCNGVLTMITHLSGKKHAKVTMAAGILAR